MKGALVWIEFAKDSFVCHPMYCSVSEGDWRFWRNQTDKENEEGPLQIIRKSDIVSIKVMTNPMAFEIKQTNYISKLFMFQHYKYLLLFKPYLNQDQPESNTPPANYNFQDPVDPSTILNDDSMGLIFSNFYHMSDYTSVLSVCKHWNKRYTPLVRRLTDHYIQNHYVEHQQKFKIEYSSKRIQMKTNYQPVVILPYRHDIAISGSPNTFQTWCFNIAIWTGKWYFEVIYEDNISYTQMGWMTCTCDCKPRGLTMKGVGDDENSWGYDPTRVVTFHKEKEKNYGPSGTLKGDVFGCKIDIQGGEISFTKNGVELGAAYSEQNIQVPIFPSVTLHSQTKIHAALKPEHIKYLPEGYTAVGDGIPEESILVEGMCGTNYLHYVGDDY